MVDHVPAIRPTRHRLGEVEITRVRLNCAAASGRHLGRLVPRPHVHDRVVGRRAGVEVNLFPPLGRLAKVDRHGCGELALELERRVERARAYDARLVASQVHHVIREEIAHLFK